MKLRLVVALVACAALVLPAVADAHTLTFGQAKRAAAKKGKQIAKKPVRVSSVLRQSRHRYYTQAKWSRVDPDGCKGCGFDPDTFETFDTATTESCFAEITVKLRRGSRRPIARVQSRACF